MGSCSWRRLTAAHVNLTCHLQPARNAMADHTLEAGISLLYCFYALSPQERQATRT